MSDILDSFDAFDGLLGRPNTEVPANAEFIPWHEWQWRMIDRAMAEGKVSYRRRMALEQKAKAEQIMSQPATGPAKEALFEPTSRSMKEQDFWN